MSGLQAVTTACQLLTQQDKRSIRAHTFWILAVPEIILLRIGNAEDPVPQHLDTDDAQTSEPAEFNRREGKVTRLKRVHEWDPNVVSKGEHETETVGCDIHRRQDCGLIQG